MRLEIAIGISPVEKKGFHGGSGARLVCGGDPLLLPTSVIDRMCAPDRPVHQHSMGEWLRAAPIWLLGLLLLVAASLFASAGAWFARWVSTRARAWQLSETQQGYVVTSAYALLGLLIGFTFSFAVERYQVRAQLVVQDAKAIDTFYLETQLLPEPHRSKLSGLLLQYAETHLEIGQTHRRDARASELLARDDLLLRQLWTAVIPAFESVRSIDFSSVFVDSAVELSNVDLERRALRRAIIPTTVIVVLVFYSLVAAAVLGAVMRTRNQHQVSVPLLLLYILALMLITDLNRPVDGTIHEPQAAMSQVVAELKANPPSIYQQPLPERPPSR